MPRPLPAYNGKDPYVFVSYSHADEADVYAEIRRLQDQGINVWYDTTGIGPGGEWNDEIARAIKGASHFLYFVTPNSVASEHCRRELNFAQSEDRRVVVVHLVKTALPDGLRLSLDNRQAILRHRLSETDFRGALFRALANVSTSAAIESPEGVASGSKGVRHLRRALAPVLGAIVAAILVWWYSEQPSSLTSDAPEVHDSRSIAVLPFVNIGKDLEQEYFSEGIAEDILNQLSRSAPSLTVRPRSSSFALEGQLLDIATIGERLRVTHVLDGSVRRLGDTVRLNVQLSEVSRNRSVWSGQYDLDITDIFKIQDKITDEILAAMGIAFSAPEGPREFSGTEGYSAFLQGRYHSSRREIKQALEWFGRATDLDPANAEAWAERARLVDWALWVGVLPNTAESREQRSEYVRRALAIDPTHPGARAIKAVWVFIEDRQYQRSIDQLAEIVSTNPNSDVALMYLEAALGAIDWQSETYERVARRRSLVSNSARAEIEGMLMVSGRLQEARTLYESASKSGMPVPPDFTIQLAIVERDVEALELALASGKRSDGSLTVDDAYASVLVPYLRGDFDGARKLLATWKQDGEEQRFPQNFYTALIERDFDSAVDYFDKAVYSAEPTAFFWHFNTHHIQAVYPEFIAHPSYRELLVELKLDPASRAQIQIPELPF